MSGFEISGKSTFYKERGIDISSENALEHMHQLNEAVQNEDNLMDGKGIITASTNPTRMAGFTTRQADLAATVCPACWCMTMMNFLESARA